MLRLTLAQAVFLSVASAGTFYVAPHGHDGNPGTSALPWATLQHAVDMISPGDTILVQSGTYEGCRIGISGSDQAPKTLQAASGAQVVINKPGQTNKHNSNIEVENFAATVTDWVISGFDVTNSRNYGIDVRVTDRITVLGNHVHHSHATGIFTAFSDDLLIQNNESDHNGEHGIYVSNSSVSPTLHGNRVHNNADAGIHMNGDMSQPAPSGHTQTGLIQNATVEDNVIWENGRHGGSAINCDGVDDSIFRNNLLYNNHASGISLYAIDGAHGSSNNKVYNNTIVMATNSRWPINIPHDQKAAPTGNDVENNIIYTPDANHGSILIASSSVMGFKSDYNVIVPRFSDNNGQANITLAQWQALGYDMHSIAATPAQLFIDPATQNYQLVPTSPAIDAGTTLLDVPVDILGVTRPQGSAYDIGCYEVVSTIVLPM
jgi:parallel beta-helix repeat protein